MASTPALSVLADNKTAPPKQTPSDKVDNKTAFSKEKKKREKTEVTFWFFDEDQAVQDFKRQMHTQWNKYLSSINLPGLGCNASVVTEKVQPQPEPANATPLSRTEQRRQNRLNETMILVRMLNLYNKAERNGRFLRKHMVAYHYDKESGFLHFGATVFWPERGQTAKSSRLLNKETPRILESLSRDMKKRLRQTALGRFEKRPTVVHIGSNLNDVQVKIMIRKAMIKHGGSRKSPRNIKHSPLSLDKSSPRP